MILGDSRLYPTCHYSIRAKTTTKKGLSRPQVCHYQTTKVILRENHQEEPT